MRRLLLDIDGTLFFCAAIVLLGLKLSGLPWENPAVLVALATAAATGSVLVLV